MQTYKEFRPTGFDSHISLEEREDWLVLDLIRTRDSNCLERANFDAALEALDGEHEACEVHRFGHWGPGWFEIILVDPTWKKGVGIAEDIERALVDYPVLDENRFSQYESDEEFECWENWGRRDFEKRLEQRLECTPKCFEVLEVNVEAIEELAEECRQHANWWCEHHSDGPSWNLNVVDSIPLSIIAGVVKKYRKKGVHSGK